MSCTGCDYSFVNPYAAVKRHCRGLLTKREGVVQKVNQYGDAGEQVVEISFITEGDVYRLDRSQQTAIGRTI